MKKKIIILGSTGSIGKSTLDVVKNNKKNFDVILLSANNNYKKLIQQAKEFKVKNILIYNKSHFEKVKKSLKNSKTKIYFGNISLNKIVKKKVDYTMSAIVGLAGLQPTIDAIKISKTVALANKEAIICGWNIISKLKKKYKTEVLPVDSEHFAILQLTKDYSDKDVNNIIITASGGPFLNIKKNKLNKVTPEDAIKHPNWKMGKKISVDSATMMNKVFEVVEAYKLFNFSKDKYKIIIHPQSYVHSIIHFKNGLTKMILYDADMKIPIFNTIYKDKNFFKKTKSISSKNLNNMKFEEVNLNSFPSVKLIDKCLNSGFSTPIIVNACNEVLVNYFLNEKIGFLDIVKKISRIFKDKDFQKYAKRKPKSLNDIRNIDRWARLKTTNMCVR